MLQWGILIQTKKLYFIHVEVLSREHFLRSI